MFKVIRATTSEDIERLKPVALEWKETCNGEMMGIELVPESHFADLASLIYREDADLFLLVNEEDNTAIGYMGITCFKSPICNQRMANEHYLYVAEESRGRGIMLLIKKAKEWAKEKGCSHLIFNASNLASDLHDKVCKFYERIGLNIFETSYIQEVL